MASPMPVRQYNVRLETRLIDELEKASDRFGRDSGNKVAAEIIEKYLPFWLSIESARQQAFDQQREQVGLPDSFEGHPLASEARHFEKGKDKLGNLWTPPPDSPHRKTKPKRR